MKIAPRGKPSTAVVETKKIVEKSDIEKLVEDTSPTKMRRNMNIHKLGTITGNDYFSPRHLNKLVSSPTNSSFGNYSAILSPKN